MKIKKNIPLFVTLGLIFCSLIISIILFYHANYGKKFVFIFPSVEEGNYVLETRYLKNNPEKDYLNYFVDELVLGSSLERTKNLFTAGTKVLSCFERNDVVYIDLSADIINMGDNVLEIKDGIDLLKKNIIKNYPGTKEIRVFVDGKYAFE